MKSTCNFIITNGWDLVYERVRNDIAVRADDDTSAHVCVRESSSYSEAGGSTGRVTSVKVPGNPSELFHSKKPITIHDVGLFPFYYYVFCLHCSTRERGFSVCELGRIGIRADGGDSWMTANDWGKRKEFMYKLNYSLIHWGLLSFSVNCRGNQIYFIHPVYFWKTKFVFLTRVSFKVPTEVVNVVLSRNYALVFEDLHFCLVGKKFVL